MKTTPLTDLGQGIVRFLEHYLPEQRGLSPHTIHSYRDTLVLLLTFMAKAAGVRIEGLAITDLTAKCSVEFLTFLHTDRHNRIATRNVRLSAIHALARFLAAQYPEHLGTLQGVLAIPFHRGASQAPIDYLEREEMDALLKSINRSRPGGERDYALFALMFNTGARVSELLRLCRRDVRLERPAHVRLQGKGNKVRLCPLWPATAQHLGNLIKITRPFEGAPEEAPIFTNARGERLTRFGVGYLLRKHLTVAGAQLSSLRGKRLHPHSLRHTTAICLLKAGVDFATISQWLGHASLNTTMRYARADLELKRQALAQAFPEALSPPRAGQLRLDGADLLGRLRRM